MLAANTTAHGTHLSVQNRICVLEETRKEIQTGITNKAKITNTY